MKKLRKPLPREASLAHQCGPDGCTEKYTARGRVVTGACWKGYNVPPTVILEDPRTDSPRDGLPQYHNILQAPIVGRAAVEIQDPIGHLRYRSVMRRV